MKPKRPAKTAKPTKAEPEKQLVKLRKQVEQLKASLTKFQQVKEALRRSESRFRQLFHEAPVGYHEIDSQGRITEINKTELTMLGYSAQEMLGRPVWEFVVERETSRRAVAAKFAGTQPLQTFERTYQRKDGSSIQVVIQEKMLRDSQGKPIAIRTTLQDVSQLRRAEKALADEKERLAVTLHSIGDGVITTDIQGRVVLVNQVAEKLTGWTQQSAQGKPLTEVFRILNEKTRQPCANPVERVLKSGGIVELGNHTILISMDGTERVLAHSAAPIKDRDSQVIGVVLVFRDITEKRKMEEELLRTDKLESVGVLAGGIAHDFNNILTVILGNMALAKSCLSPGDEAYEILTETQQAVGQAKSLTQQLLTFSKGGAPVKGVTSIGELITDSAGFALRGSNVKGEFAIHNHLWPVEIDTGQISQVMHNLAINAGQAMPQGGTIHIGAENLLLGATRVKNPPPLPDGRYIHIWVRDRGGGIPREDLKRIFDPYFTTKRKGSGLGLTTSFSIVKSHDGYIGVESQLGAGTTFHVYLPALSGVAPTKAKRQKITLAAKGRILLMDDEAGVQKVAYKLLSRVGYEVHLVSDGSEAISCYEGALKGGRPFDVVILDLTVPGGMGGQEAVKRLRKLDPHVKAVVSSGYCTDPVMANYRNYGFHALIAKPYGPEDLTETLDKVMSGELDR